MNISFCRIRMYYLALSFSRSCTVLRFAKVAFGKSPLAALPPSFPLGSRALRPSTLATYKMDGSESQLQTSVGSGISSQIHVEMDMVSCTRSSSLTLNIPLPTQLRSLRRALASLIKSKEERSVDLRRRWSQSHLSLLYHAWKMEGGGTGAGGGGQAGQFLHLGPSSVPLGR